MISSNIKQILKNIVIISLCCILCIDTNYSANIIYSSKEQFNNVNIITTSNIKLDSILEVLKEYQRIGYYNKLMFEDICLNNKQMSARMDCSGFLSAYVVNFYNKNNNTNYITGLNRKDANQIDLSSINFTYDGDSNHTKYLDNIKITSIEDLQIGDICWSGSHFIIYGGKTNNIDAPFIFYHWSGETKEDNKNYKDYKATDYCELYCKLDYIKKKNKVIGIKIIPKNNNYAGIMNSKEYKKFYRLKERL